LKRTADRITDINKYSAALISNQDFNINNKIRSLLG